ncbi:MAG: SAF domain-containing protein [Acidimicrobiia bacterium]
MTATLERQVEAPRVPSMVRRRSPRLSLALVALLVTVASALGFVAWARSIGDRTEVLVAARDISSGGVISRSDLGVARIAGDRSLRAIDAGSMDRVVGKIAAGPIPRGTLMNPDLMSGAPVLGADEAIVGVAVRSGQAPVAKLSPGLTVMVVRTPSSGSNDADATVLASRAVVQAVTKPDRADAAAAALGSAQFVTLAVSANVAPDVAAASAADRVRLVLVAPR